MAKKNIIQREKLRRKIVDKFYQKREDIKNLIYNYNLKNDKNLLKKKLIKLPKNSCKSRIHNRCEISGRPRGFYRFFKLSRNFVRNFGHLCFLPGIIKSSW